MKRLIKNLKIVIVIMIIIIDQITRKNKKAINKKKILKNNFYKVKIKFIVKLMKIF